MQQPSGQSIRTYIPRSHLLRSATSNIHLHAARNLPDQSPIAMACSSRPPQLQLAARPRPLPPPPHVDTTLTLALPPRSLLYALSPRPPHARRPRPDGGATALARVRSTPTGDTPPPPCTECGRPFPTWKALFGHMRSHPERQWRGMTPPPQFRHGALGAPPLAVAAAEQITAQEERDVAASLLMLAGARPGGGKGKKSILASSSSAKEGGSTSPSSPTAPAPPRCGGDRKRAEEVVVATHGSCGSALPMSEAPATMLLDLNLPPPGMPLPRKSDQSSSLNVSLDLKLGY